MFSETWVGSWHLEDKGIEFKWSIYITVVEKKTFPKVNSTITMVFGILCFVNNFINQRFFENLVLPTSNCAF